MHGIGLRQYLQDQQHVYLTSEDAEALTTGLMATFPSLADDEKRGEFHDPLMVHAETDFPLNMRYIKPMLTRLRNAHQHHKDYIRKWDVARSGPIPAHILNGPTFNPATETKHKRALEVRKMYDEIDRLRAEVGYLRRKS